MKGNKFLAAALAASMVFSTVPATALSVFADSVSVEASDVAWTNGQVSVDVAADLNGKADTAKAIKTALNADTGIDIEQYWTNGEWNADADTPATTETTVSGGTAKVPTKTETGSKFILKDGKWYSISALKAGGSITVGTATKGTSIRVTGGTAAGYTVSGLDDGQYISDGSVWYALGSEAAGVSVTGGSAANGDTITVTATGSVAKERLVSAIQALTGNNGTYTVDADSVKVTDKNHWSFSIYKTSDNQEVYNVTVATVAKANTLKDAAKDNTKAEKVYTLLNDFFATSTFYTYDNKNLTTAYIAGKASDGISAKAASYNLGDITGNTTAVSSDGKGTINVEVDGTTYTYDFTANIEKSADSEAAALQKALDVVEQNSYPSVASGDSGVLTKKIATDLVAAGYKKSVADAKSQLDALVASGYAPATKDTDGALYGFIGRVPVSIKVVYSSAQKSADTNNSIYKASDSTGFLAGRSTGRDTIGTEAIDTFKFDAGSQFSNSVQKSTDIKAVDDDTVLKALQDGIDAQLTKDKVADNGVTVTVAKAKNVKSSGTDVKTTKATATTKGQYVYLVTTSIANDFYGYKAAAADTAAFSTDAKSASNNNETHKYIVIVETSELNSKKATSVTASDVNAVLKKNYTINFKADGTTVTPAVPVDVVDLKAAVAPDDANTAVTWSVTDEDGATTTDAFVAEVDDTNVDGIATNRTTPVVLKDKNGKDVDEIKATSGKLIVYKAGTYKVTASVDGQTSTATVKVFDDFSDNKANDTYFYVPVKWAYQKGVTSGVSGSDFGTNTTVTRGQFVTWLYNLAVANGATTAIKDEDVKDTFSDVPTTAYYAKAVQWAKAAGVASGTGDGKFTPNKEISRAQALTMVYNYAGKPDTGASGRETENTTNFTDVKAGAYYLPAVTWAVNHSGRNDYDASGNGTNRSQIASGKSVTTFDPEGDCTRAQAITFVYRAFGKTGSGATGAEKVTLN